MSDRFRFRVWNKTEKVYLKMPEMHCDNTGCFLSVMEDEVLEQCTGLRDKNGRLIYEGDIVIVNGDVMTIPLEYENKKAFINWDDCGFYLHFENGLIENLFQECWIFEIIGNIHENPELLEGKK